MSKMLVTYFSVYGTARAVAEEITHQTGADLVEIEPVVPYDSDRDHYHALARLAKKEHDEDMRPALKGHIPVEDYDVVFVGYPMWWYTFPMAMYTFFDEHDFAGKTIVPFNTHMGSSDGGTYDTIRQLEPEATVLAGLPVEMSDAERGVPEVIAQWLAGLNL